MTYKMVCIDIDGTILNDKHKLLKETKQALIDSHTKGVHIVICSGRVFSDAEYYSNILESDSPIIGSNGAIIKDKKSNKIIFKKVLGLDLCFELLRIISKHHMKASFYTTDKIYSNNPLFSLINFIGKILGIIGKGTKLRYVFNSRHWRNIINKEVDDIVKCEIFCTDVIKLNTLRNELKELPNIEIVSQPKNSIEITVKGVTKGTAVEFIANYCNIKKEKVIAIGDSENDISMIQYAGLGIAMGNAFDKIKERADFVTASNNDDGVARAIDKFILSYELDNVI